MIAADLVRDAVVERQDLGPALGRDDVVERAPGGVRDAALGDLLGEPEERGGGEPESHQPQAEAPDVDERQDQRRPRDAEARIDPVGHERVDTTSDVAVTAADRRPRAVARLASVVNVCDADLHERIGHRGHEDREQDVRDRDEAHQRRADDAIEADCAARRRPMHRDGGAAPGPS